MSEGQGDSVAVLHGVITISRGESSQTIILSPAKIKSNCQIFTYHLVVVVVMVYFVLHRFLIFGT